MHPLPPPPYQRGVGKGIAGEWAKEYAPCLRGIVGNKYCRVLMANSFSVTTPTRPPDNIFYKFNGKKIVKVYNSFPENYPCNQTVHYKGNIFFVILDYLLEN